MSEQTVPDIYEWIKAMRDGCRVIIIVEAEVDLMAPDPGMEGDEDD